MQQIPYTLQRKNVKYVRIKITPRGDVCVIAPFAVPLAEVEKWVESKKDWILTHLQKIAANKQENALGLQEKEILLFGEPYSPNFDTTNTAYLSKWLKFQAKAYMIPKVYELAEKHGFVVSKVFIRDTQTKWGSCSTKGNIGLNYRLVQTPPRIIDYVIIHELCHLRVFNHSPAFWAEVAKYFPEYKQAKEWLRKYEAQLLHG